MVGGCFHCPECKLYTMVWLAMLSCGYSPIATMPSKKKKKKKEGRVAFLVITRRVSVPEYSLLIPTGSKATTHRKLQQSSRVSCWMQALTAHVSQSEEGDSYIPHSSHPGNLSVQANISHWLHTLPRKLQCRSNSPTAMAAYSVGARTSQMEELLTNKHRKLRVLPMQQQWACNTTKK